jgi:hypothetical protein
MQNNGDSFSLDNSAEELYKQLAGIDNTVRADQNISSQSAIMAQLNQEEEQLDYYRFRLAQLTCIFVGILYNSLFAILDKENEQKIDSLIKTLKKIAKFPKFNGKIFCHLRGQQCPSEKIGSEACDYELSLGNILVDYQIAKEVEERSKASSEAIYTKLMEAFKGLSAMNIFNFSIDIGAGGEEDYERIRNTIKYLVKFHHKHTDHAKFMVLDEYGQPNINLTVLAATNRVKPATLQMLIHQIKPMMFGTTAKASLNSFTTVYDVIIASKQYREKLKKMPIEVNNVQWLTESILADPQKKIENVQTSRFVLLRYGSNLKMAAEVIASVNKGGYSNIHADVMSKRLTKATEFLHLAEESEDKHTLQNEALQNIEYGLDQLQDEIFDSFEVKDKEVSSVNDKGEKTELVLHEKLSGLLVFFKQRSTTKKKVLDIANKNVKFNAEDYAVIAKNFNITEQGATHLIDLLKACFDEKGNFRRPSFEINIPEFVQYGTKVFEFLWHYLKELSSKKDRVSFLNALQILIARLKEPQEAMKILLSDIFNRSSVVNFSDRNGFMLATILLRFYNREEGSNIELTPEEVLLIRKGLNPLMVNTALAFIEQNKENVIKKFRRITEVLNKSITQENPAENDMKPRFLLYLERELVIFLALLGDSSSQAIIHGVVEEFGKPGSPYYKEMSNKENIRHSLHLLQVAVRALKRFNDPGADDLFETIVNKQSLFINLHNEPSYSDFVKKVMERIKHQN